MIVFITKIAKFLINILKLLEISIFLPWNIKLLIDIHLFRLMEVQTKGQQLLQYLVDLRSHLMHRYNTDSRFVEKFPPHQWMLLMVKSFPGTEIRWTFLEVRQIYHQRKVVLSTEYVKFYVSISIRPQ